jgi:hypothetical protein
MFRGLDESGTYRSNVIGCSCEGSTTLPSLSKKSIAMTAYFKVRSDVVPYKVAGSIYTTETLLTRSAILPVKVIIGGLKVTPLTVRAFGVIVLTFPASIP